MINIVRSLVLACAALLGACSQSQTVRQGKVNDQALNRVYAAAEAAIRQADLGLAFYGKGENAEALSQLSEARETLMAAAADCAARAGCDMSRIVAMQDALLDRQAKAMLGAQEADEALLPKAVDGAPNSQSLRNQVPAVKKSLALLKGHDMRQMITMNAQLKSSIEEWLTALRPNLLDAYEYYQFMRHRMWPSYHRAGLPEALLFGILAKESGGKVHAVSRAGASGPLQFMPQTGLRYGLSAQGGFDLRFDPAAATKANVSYLEEQFLRLNNNLELVLGAYNGGEGRMQRLSQNGAKGFWNASVYNRLPPETRDYVPMVLAAAWLFLHPGEYNLEFPLIDARAGTLALPLPISISELAVCMGQGGNGRGWFRILRNLNPRHDANVRLAAGTALEVPLSALSAYRARCATGGKLLAITRELHEAQPPAAAAYRPAASVANAGGERTTHIVKRGETLFSIARRFGCENPRGLAAANRITAPVFSIRPGQKLIVPACKA